MYTLIIALLLLLACPPWALAGWFQDQEAAITTINGASPSLPSPPAGHIFYWDGESSAAADGMGTPIAASATGGVPAYTAACGYSGNGFDTQGSSWVRYDIADATDFDFQSGTIIIYASLNTEASYDALFQAYVDTSNYIFAQTNNTTPHYIQEVYRGGATSNYATGATTALSTMRQIWIKWDQTANETHVYIDGVEETSELSLTDFTGTAGTITFGADNAGGNIGDWCIDDVYIYDTVETP